MSDVYPASSRCKARVNGHQTGAKNSKTCELPQTNEWIGNTDHHERNMAISLVFTLNVHCETGSGMAVVTVLRPKITCDEILTVSVIRHDHLPV